MFQRVPYSIMNKTINKEKTIMRTMKLIFVAIIIVLMVYVPTFAGARYDDVDIYDVGSDKRDNDEEIAASSYYLHVSGEIYVESGYSCRSEGYVCNLDIPQHRVSGEIYRNTEGSDDFDDCKHYYPGFGEYTIDYYIFVRIVDISPKRIEDKGNREPFLYAHCEYRYTWY